MNQNNKYSYVTVLTNDTYTDGVLLLAESLKRVNSKYPLACIVTKDVSDACLDMISQMGCKIILKDNIEMPENIQKHNKETNDRTAVVWRNCLTKLNIFDLSEFDKIVFLDADVMVLQNIDELFEKPHMTSCLDGEYFNIWPKYPHFNSGCLVIEPNPNQLNGILDYMKTLPESALPKQPVADQEVLNLYFKDWPNHSELHLDKYYDIFAPYVQEEDVEDLDKNCKFIHFIGRKPWVKWIHNPEEHYSEHFYEMAQKMLLDVYSKIDMTKAREKLKLAVYAICKNEKENVDRFLKSYSEADYVCILDTGSTDGTYEYLEECKKQYPNLIIDKKEYEDFRFDRARNDSMKLIPNDVTIFFMNDMDEEIREKGWAKKVKDAWDPTFSRMGYTYFRDINENGNVMKSMTEYRIHSKEWIFWKNRVHEQIANIFGDIMFDTTVVKPVDIHVFHSYCKNHEEKSKNYVELCKKAIKENPADIHMKLQLALEYEVIDDNANALKTHLEIIYSGESYKLFRHELARSYFYIARDFIRNRKVNQGIQYLNIAISIAPYYLDNYYLLMELYLALEDYKHAKDIANTMLKNCKEDFWCSFYSINSGFIYEDIANILVLNSDITRAFAFVELAKTLGNTTENFEKLEQSIKEDILENRSMLDIL